MVTFIDDYSRYAWVVFIKKKSDVFPTFQKWEEYVKAKHGASIKFLRTDFGGKYMSAAFREFLHSKGIEHEESVPHTPEHNGVAERKNRSLLDSARCMLLHFGLGGIFWAEAVYYANIISNCGPTKVLKSMTPYQAIFDTVPSVSCFRVFGCRALALIQRDKPGKFDPRTKEMVYLEPGENTSGYKLWNPHTHKVQHNRNVHFFEHIAPVSHKLLPPHNPFLVPSDEDIPSFITYQRVSETPVIQHDQVSVSVDILQINTVASPVPPLPLPPPTLVRTGWKMTDE